MAKVHLKRKVRLDRFLDELVGAAAASYGEIFGPGASSRALQEMEERMRSRFREILRMDMEVAEECGLSIFCQEATLHEPWSDEAERALAEDEEAQG